jgi:hypothetical protein
MQPTTKDSTRGIPIPLAIAKKIKIVAFYRKTVNSNPKMDIILNRI